MERNGYILSLLLMFMILADICYASFVMNFRKSIGAIQRDSSPVTHITPVPSPVVSRGNESNPTSTVDAIKSENTTDPKVTNTNNSSNLIPKGVNNNNSNNTITGSVDANPPTDKQIQKEKNHEVNEKDKQMEKEKNHVVNEKGDHTSFSELVTSESCEGVWRRCRIQDTMLACIQTSEHVSKEVAVLVQNEGENTLKVNLAIPTSMDSSLQAFELLNHQTKKIKISSTVDESSRIVLNTGTRVCVLHMELRKSEGSNFFEQLTFYSKQMTPLYSAYFFVVVALIFGGTWAFCKLKKKRAQGGVAYQELEMGVPEPDTARNVDTAEGWDEHWDDDWDEDNSVKSPGGHHVGSISANGLSSRSSKNDGWENDWDD
ncbi:hypothetical protein LguiA_032012 [Lonicera macranthoides]